MPLIQLLEVLIVVGVLLWLVKSLHSHAGDDQVNFQRHRGHRRGSVDPECHWAVPFTSEHTPWERITMRQAIVHGTQSANA